MSDSIARSSLRTIAVLELVAGSSSPLSLDQVTSLSGLPKPTAYRLLSMLVREEFLSREAIGKRYEVGRRLVALAFQAQLHAPGHAEREAILASLVDEIGETCNLTILDGNEVVYLSRVETPSPIRLHMEIGSRVPLHCTASGKLFLAHLTPARMQRLIGSEPFTKFTDTTITNLVQLERELERIRDRGFSTENSEYFEGSVCLAVPVHHARARVCAAVAVHGPTPRLSIEKGMQFLPSLRNAAQEIGKLIQQ